MAIRTDAFERPRWSQNSVVPTLHSKIVKGTLNFLKDASLIDPLWALQDPMKQGGSIKAEVHSSGPTPFLCGICSAHSRHPQKCPEKPHPFRLLRRTCFSHTANVLFAYANISTALASLFKRLERQPRHASCMPPAGARMFEVQV